MPESHLFGERRLDWRWLRTVSQDVASVFVTKLGELGRGTLHLGVETLVIAQEGGVSLADEFGSEASDGIVDLGAGRCQFCL
jgi:hypothetical protein